VPSMASGFPLATIVPTRNVAARAPKTPSTGWRFRAPNLDLPNGGGLDPPAGLLRTARRGDRDGGPDRGSAPRAAHQLESAAQDFDALSGGGQADVAVRDRLPRVGRVQSMAVVGDLQE